MLDINEVKDYLGVTFDDTDKLIEQYMFVADGWLKGAIGDKYDPSDDRVKQLALFVIEDLYDRKSFSVKENASLERLRNDFIMQLQCEGRNVEL